MDRFVDEEPVGGGARGATVAHLREHRTVDRDVEVGIVFARTRRMALWSAAVLFVAVYPANLYMAWEWRDRELSERLVAYGRLPLQIPMIWWAVALARRTATHTN